MAKIKVNRSDLEMAFDMSDYESEAFIDTQTGKIITIYEDISSPLSYADYDDTTPIEAILKEIEEKSGELSDWIRDAVTELIAIKRDSEGRYLGNSATRFTDRLW